MQRVDLKVERNGLRGLHVAEYQIIRFQKFVSGFSAGFVDFTDGDAMKSCWLEPFDEKRSSMMRGPGRAAFQSSIEVRLETLGRR